MRSVGFRADISVTRPTHEFIDAKDGFLPISGPEGYIRRIGPSCAMEVYDSVRTAVDDRFDDFDGVVGYVEALMLEIFE